ncbi:hypothetical protein GQ457_09G018050 [Hibiscus cannabinus]
MSPFEVVYGFNPITPLDLLPLPREQVMNNDGQSKAEYVRQLHQQVKENLERRTQQYTKHADKGQKRVTFEVGDWVWVHFRKERFPAQRSSKLLPRGDGPFQVVEKINENAYKFEEKSFSRRGDDESTSSSAHIADPEVLLQGPVTRERTRIQELKPSSVEARRFVCSSFQLKEANTPSASSIQLNTAPFSSTSAPLAQLKLNNPEATETRPANMLTTILTSRRYKEARFIGCPERAYISPRSVTYEEGSFRQAISYHEQSKKDSIRLVSAQEADTPSASSFHLNSAQFSSTSALLAQLKLNNPKVAETYPAQGRVSYEHVDIMWGVLHQSMHMHSMCGSLGMLWEFAYNIPRSVTFEETTFRQVTSYQN